MEIRLRASTILREPRIALRSAIAIPAEIDRRRITLGAVVFPWRGLPAARRCRGLGVGIGAEWPLRGGGGGGVGVEVFFLLGGYWGGVFLAGGRGFERVVVVGCGLGRGGRGREIMVVGAVCLAVQPAYTSGFLMAVGAHVGVVVVAAAARGLALLRPPRLLARGGGFLGVDGPLLLVPVLLRGVGDDAATAEICGFRGAAQGGAVGAFAPQHGGFVVVPVALAPDEAAVLGPEEEPDTGEDEGDADEGEEGEEAAVVDAVRVEGAGAGAVGGCGRGGVAALEVGGLEGREGSVVVERGKIRRGD